MGRAPRIAGLLAVGLAAGVGLGALLWSGEDEVASDDAGVLLVQPADAGRLERVGSNRYRLVLSPPASRTYAFTDRPERRTTSFATRTTPERWFLDDFIGDPPNAALQIEPGNPGDSPQTLIFELTSPHFDPTRGELSYGASLLSSGGHPPRRFGDSALFIDDAASSVAGATASAPSSGEAPLSPQGAKTLEQVATAVSSIPQQSMTFPQMIQAAQKIQEDTAQLLKEMQEGQGENVSLATMFHLQFQMQILSQYTEAVSNVLSAVHNEMITMARATKGQ